jgi:protein-S-isoprenylcysteine O-methyltransferase Ste14
MREDIKNTRRTFWAVAVFYFLIAFEFFYMASPFAAYFYSVYRPALEFLDNYPALSWTTGFFLPHLVVETKSVLLDSISYVGAILALIGIFTFLVCAGQVYYSKLFKKSVVTKGLYKWIRHPQYTAFAICSFGLMLIWPRYLVLIMFISILFAYYYLAKAEEKECERKFGENYLNYKSKTGMFLPVRIKMPGFNKTPTKLKPLILLTLYALTLLISISLANRIKRASVNNLYKLKRANVEYLSIIEKTDEEIVNLINITSKNQAIDSLLLANPNEKIICYLLPAEVYISEIPMQAPDEAYSHVFGHKYNGEKYKFIYTKANLRYSEPERANLMNTLSVFPLFEVWVNSKTNEILKVVELEGTQRYGNISEPVF